MVVACMKIPVITCSNCTPCCLWNKIVTDWSI